MAAGWGAGRVGFGWAILVATLAVPGFLFHHWRSHLKAEHEHPLSAQAGKRAGGGVFQTPPSRAERLINPMASAAVAPAAPMPALAPSAPALSTASAVAAPSRDPTLSPLDSVRLREAALAEEERLRALARGRRSAAGASASIESRIELQGIVAKSGGGSLAIINGATVRPGQSISVANEPGKIRILKITSSEVTLEHKGRAFKLRVNK